MHHYLFLDDDNELTLGEPDSEVSTKLYTNNIISTVD